MKGALVISQIFAMVFAAGLFIISSPEVNWSKYGIGEKQSLTYSRSATNCNSAKNAGSDACNITFQGPANVGEPGSLLVTNTDADDACDESAAVGDGKCNATVTALPWYYMILKGLAICVFFGALGLILLLIGYLNT